jgi:hypothetical protein
MIWMIWIPSPLFETTERASTSSISSVDEPAEHAAPGTTAGQADWAIH